jgi:hypothetical protein
MDTTLWSILPNLGVGVASIGGLVYVIMLFLRELKEMRDEHRKSMDERESAFRDLEREVRTEILSQLSKNTAAMERVISHIDRRV